MDVKSEGDSPAELLGEAADSTMLCRVFVRIAEQGDSPSPSDDYDLALEQIGLVTTTSRKPESCSGCVLPCKTPGAPSEADVDVEPRFDLTDFDRYVEEHGIPEQDYPAAFALLIAERTGGPVPRFEKVEREAPADGVVIEGDDL